MLKKRLIPQVLVDTSEINRDFLKSKTYISKNFSKFFVTGNALSQVKIFDANKADEIVLININHTDGVSSRKFIDLILIISASVTTPLTVGGGIKTIVHAKTLIESGIEKIVIGYREGIDFKKFCDDFSGKYGSQSLQLAVDYQNISDKFLIKGTSNAISFKILLNNIFELLRFGVGEVSLTNIDKDGTREGLDLSLLRLLVENIDIPIILGGGANSPENFIEGFNTGADGIKSGTYFAKMDQSILQLRSRIANKGVEIRH